MAFESDERTLRLRVAREGPLAAEEVYRLAVDLLSQIVDRHRAGSPYGDLSPATVVMTRDGISVTGETFTPAFEAPERIDGGPQTPATDLFGWAAVVAFASSGRPPFGDGATDEIQARIRGGEPDLDQLPPTLHPIVDSCLAEDPDARPTAVDLMRQLGGAGPSAGSLPAAGATGFGAIRPVATDQAPPTITTVMRRQKAALDRARERVGRVKTALISTGAVMAVLLLAAGAAAYLMSPSSPDSKQTGSRAAVDATPTTTLTGSPEPTTTLSRKPAREPGDRPHDDPARKSTRFHRVEGPNGSSVKVPVGASLDKQTPLRYVWTEPATGAVFQVDATKWEDSDPYEHFLRFETLSPLPMMRRVGLAGPFEWRGWQTADYEFTWKRRDGQKIYAYNRGVVVSKGVYFALYFSAPADHYDRISTPRLDKLFTSFRVHQDDCCLGEPSEPVNTPH